MSQTTCEACGDQTIQPAGSCRCRADELPYDPYLSLRVSYGMLLGEDDFTVLEANPRGKLMLHNAWLHGPGVVWGYRVSYDSESGPTLRVEPGLAVDGIGRELHLDADHCLDLDCWLRDGPEPTWEADGDGCEVATLHLWLVARFETCLSRPVPALADPCEPSRSSTSFSRVYETVAFELLADRPEPCPPQPDRPETYHGLRVLLGLSEPDGRHDWLGHHALAEREAVALLPTWERAPALMAAFRHIAAHDVTRLGPCRDDGDQCPAWFPESEDEPRVVLAKVTLHLARVNDCVTVGRASIDETARAAVLPTTTIQELTCGLAPGLIGELTDPDAGGPRVIPDSVCWNDDHTEISFRVTRSLMGGSLNRGPITVSTVSPQAGWNEVDIQAIVYDEPDLTVTVHLYDRPTFDYVRLTVRGTGRSPVLGDDRVPLAGVVGGPPGTRHRGHDAELDISPEV